MRRILPVDITPERFERALTAFGAIVGKDWVLDDDIDRDAYADAYALGDATTHAPSAAIAPASVEEVQAVLRVANEFGIPLWPISRGKNYGYGGAAPCMPGTLVLDLGRMRRILDVDVRRAYCVVEPGVGFFDLYQFLEQEKLPLWAPMPGNCIGSVLGNALEHGTAYGPHGDRANNFCGMEVVLPDGELIRTGMGAMAGADAWHLFRYSYGPGWDQMFTQSNLGIVTKLGVWLMQEPEAAMELRMELPDEEDIGWVIETLAPLRQAGVIKSQVNIGNFMRYVMGSSQRDDWYRGEGAMPEDIQADIRHQRNVGWWGLEIMLYGYREVIEAEAAVIRRAFAAQTTNEFTTRLWKRGEPRPPFPHYGVPISFPLRIANWISPYGGHLGFSPILPPEREPLLAQLRRSRQMFRDYGFDFYGGFTLGERHVTVVNMLAYDRQDEDMVRRGRELLLALMADAKSRGYSEYRSHLAFMDEVAQSYDFNGHALARLNNKIKDALDPQGILAPGKQGIWPARYRKQG
ncbi:MAG: FAD-binding oxidoreductase [Gammaproteobacteria bacterium]|nr:FAD-binding oxidoreductase [Gammaproteobacteria bacterium]